MAVPKGVRYGGRQKGVANKDTRPIRELILGALLDVGGQKWLAEQAQKNPVAFMGLIAKVMPSEVKATLDNRVTLNIVTGIPDQSTDNTTIEATDIKHITPNDDTENS